MASNGPEQKLIATSGDLRALLDTIDGLDIHPLEYYRWKPAPLCIDLKPVELNGQDSIFILPLFIHDADIDTVYLVDILTLGAAAFSTANDTGTTLKGILESTTIPKMAFDVAEGKVALEQQYDVSLALTKDLQVQELARPDKRPTAPGPKTKRRGPRPAPGPIALVGCVQNVKEIEISERRAMVVADDDLRKLYDQTEGGEAAVFVQRPLKTELVRHCVDSVRFLPEIYEKYKYNHRPYYKT
ncbi:hypothetical protein CLAFUW4_06939 [Fulvia fulva]|uniref:Uncharacterized protein n=1 Tax=Passalora fulva TaxID=5499 RepID=A0A9Q8PA14_PASFU|nr:uncharacterized protein CLAFUR5_07076 [Fulvia fulva]KAK4622191.1 hypothetical protein CLAFUR4_06948 [Fulvia fulva]KAK4623138.1 hypothetical protein CLAFUR0_06946 [Fulvia fulva]UJO18630.1 hypothetical protein CLAFUR5_07076 [Fulvia fulva]WPV15696.1 hypothetical protein CLAFUW4_06939 [Fulvia fulva]WPV31424.1 hypothetical protein CLAFUW7_06939 [Fulvia fulva]